MEGTITFLKEGTFELQAVGHDDIPVPSLNGRYHFQAKEGRLNTDYKAGYGLSNYYLIQGEHLYLSERQILRAKESFDKGYLQANWQYKLVKRPD